MGKPSGEPSQAINVGSSSKRPKSHGGQGDAVCFEIGARMDSFSIVLTTADLVCISYLLLIKRDRKNKRYFSCSNGIFNKQHYHSANVVSDF